MSDSLPSEGGGPDSTAVADRAGKPAADRRGPRTGAGKLDDARHGPKPNRGGTVAGRSFFELYKRGQGTFTRGGTAVGAGLMVLAGGNFLYDQLGIMVDPNAAWTEVFRVVVPLLFVVVLGLLTYWVVGVNRKACDFMIATEGEMKKVNWSTRKEVLGSTKVVIAFTLLLALVLFVVDLLFMVFFSWIGVLREVPLDRLFGGGA